MASNSLRRGIQSIFPFCLGQKGDFAIRHEVKTALFIKSVTKDEPHARFHPARNRESTQAQKPCIGLIHEH